MVINFLGLSQGSEKSKAVIKPSNVSLPPSQNVYLITPPEF